MLPKEWSKFCNSGLLSASGGVIVVLFCTANRWGAPCCVGSCAAKARQGKAMPELVCLEKQHVAFGTVVMDPVVGNAVWRRT